MNYHTVYGCITLLIRTLLHSHNISLVHGPIYEKTFMSYSNVFRIAFYIVSCFNIYFLNHICQCSYKVRYIRRIVINVDDVLLLLL
jgi:hypothetical protein